MRQIDKKALARFESLCREIRQATTVTLNETEEQKKLRIKTLMADPRKFQQYYFPTLKETPDYIIQAVKKVLKDKSYFGWWMMFRGARKSTWANIILPMLLMARGEMKFMVLIGANEDFASRFMQSLQAQLESNQRYLHDFGIQKAAGSWADLEFTTRNDVSFLGLGMGQPPRGINVNMKRPDYIVASDLDSKALSKNPARCREMYNWLMEDVLGTIETGANGRFLFDNNYFSEVSIGHLLKKENEQIDISRVDMLDKKGNPVAPFITKEWAEDRRKKIGYRAFMREYMNTPIEEGAVFKNEWIRYKKMLPLRDYAYLISYCDPSFKASSNNDYKAIVLIGKTKPDKLGSRPELHIIRAFCRQTTALEMVRWHYDLAEGLHSQGAISYHFIEANFSQDTILQEYENEGRRRSWYMDIRADKGAKANKHERIEAVAVKWETQQVFYNEKLRDDEDMRIGIAQTLAFEKGSKVHDDFPDACEGAIAWLDTYTRDTWTDSEVKPSLGKRRQKHSY